jgi:hypothetical protein
MGGEVSPVYQGTFGTITAGVIAKLRLDETADLAGVKEAVNVAYQETVQTTGCLQKTATAAMTADVESYDLPFQVAWIRSTWITYPDGSFTDPLQQVTLEQIEEQRRATAASGQQVVRPIYALAGQNQIEVWPTPTADQSMTFVYVYLPDALVADADEPLLMEPYGSMLLQYGALVELARFKKDPLLQDYEQAYAMWLSRFQLWLNRRQGSSARTFRIGSTSSRIRFADRSADVA